MKLTRLRCFRVPGANFCLERICRQDPCRYSGAPHIRLTDTDAHGGFWTLRACAYPWPLCDRLFAALVYAARMKAFAERAGVLKVSVGLRNAISGLRKEDDEMLSEFSLIDDVLQELQPVVFWKLRALLIHLV